MCSGEEKGKGKKREVSERKGEGRVSGERRGRWCEKE